VALMPLAGGKGTVVKQKTVHRPRAGSPRGTPCAMLYFKQAQ